MFSLSSCFHFIESQGINLQEQPKLDLLCDKAVQEVQDYLEVNTWEHNFGLGDRNDLKPIGKMFGVLVVVKQSGEWGYLAGFSGKIGESNRYGGFVPPVFDGIEEDNFLSRGMKELVNINQQIAALGQSTDENSGEISRLKDLRRSNSNELQEGIYRSYELLNAEGIRKNLKEIFNETRGKNPPGGAGDCAAPKLLQYAFLHDLKPLILTEFYWGVSVHSDQWKHKHHYPPCEHKCEPILEHMLSGVNIR